MRDPGDLVGLGAPEFVRALVDRMISEPWEPSAVESVVQRQGEHLREQLEAAAAEDLSDQAAFELAFYSAVQCLIHASGAQIVRAVVADDPPGEEVAKAKAHDVAMYTAAAVQIGQRGDREGAMQRLRDAMKEAGVSPDELPWPPSA